MTRGGARWAIFAHDPDGDMGYGTIVGAFKDAGAADRKADAIRRAAERDGREVECIVLPLEPGSIGAATVARDVLRP